MALRTKRHLDVFKAYILRIETVNFVVPGIMKIVVCTIIEVSAVSNFADLSDILET